MRIEKIILVSGLALFATACSLTTSGFEVKTVGFSPEFAAGVVSTMDAITPTPDCKTGEVLVTAHDATVTNRSDSNGLRGAGTAARPGRQLTARERRDQPLFVGNETAVLATSEQWCAQR